jgi:predicted N-acetyltransferase YhbS
LFEVEILKIRQEKPSDFRDIYDLVKVGFGTAEVSNGNEQDYVIKLRTSGNYIPELALVAARKRQAYRAYHADKNLRFMQ